MSNQQPKDEDPRSSLEKAPHESTLHVEELMRGGLTEEDAQFLHDMPLKEQSRIYHKVDIRLVPMLALLYLVAHLDRANIGNAKIEGLEKSLGMTGTDYNVACECYISCSIDTFILLDHGFLTFSP